MSTYLPEIFDAALREYAQSTGITLADQPIAERLRNCDSPEAILEVLHDQAEAFRQFRGKEKVLQPLQGIVSSLFTFSAVANIGRINTVRP